MCKKIYIPELADIGYKLADIRKNKNIAIPKITEDTGLSERNINDIENVEALYPIHHLIIYAKYLGTSIILSV